MKVTGALPEWYVRDLFTSLARPRCGQCGTPLRGRQTRWCGDACKTRARFLSRLTGGIR